MSKSEIPKELQTKLDEFHVDLPEIPTKLRKLDRLANWVHAPAMDPLEIFSIKGNSITKLVFYPLICLLFIFFTPIFLI
ncbi:hypothetical protein LS684_16400 [Cytobacillus spongiae]|jgi:hypothetical protein|uniref:hypothetical protein n=1 Tax=Cytobacillus spongiae TaxID=2901381 RepID=UPI001F161750|nr:hypothetical protein [Cytobacillus spongiae]UII55219.1 hypothetical protein LS684_16400 [Cytobacillus spongiae]